jgi:Domain of unknown function (DUF4405)
MSARARLLLDLALFAALLAAYNPGWTGLAWHEWLCVAAIVPLLFHLVINWDKVLRVLSTFAEKLWHGSRLDLVVDSVLFVLGVTAMVSGVMVSQVVAPALGVHITPTTIWVSVHAWSADLTIILLLVHTALHWRWIYKCTLSFAGRVAGSGRAERRPEDVVLAGLRRENRRLGFAPGLEPAREPVRARAIYPIDDPRS